MKIKATLAIAAATLAVGAITSQAQVYSQNIVGYVNVPLVKGYNMIANPLDDGNGNQLTNLFASLPNKSQILTWHGTVYDTSIGKGGGVWGGNTNLPPGLGFFLNSPSATTITNTFSGSLYDPAGQGTGDLVTNVLPVGYTLVGSQLPYAGDATLDNTNLALAPVLANKSQLLSWNPSTQVFNTSVGKGGGVWGGSFPVTVGQGFFVNVPASHATNWVQTLP